MDPQNPSTPENQPVAEPQPVAAPAPASAASGYQSNPWSLVSPSWHGVLKNFWDYIGVFLLFVGVSAASALLSFVLFNVTPVLGILAGIALFVLDIVVFATATVRVILASAKGEDFPFKTAFQNVFGVGFRLLGASILMTLIFVGGFILLIVPGLIFVVRFGLTPYALVEENLGVMDSLRRSWRLTAGRFWDTAGAVSLPSAFQVLSLVPVIGPFLSLIASFLLIPVTAVRYLQLKNLKDAGAPLPPTHALNYVFVVVAIVLSFVTGNHDRKFPATNSNNTGIPYGNDSFSQ